MRKRIVMAIVSAAIAASGIAVLSPVLAADSSVSGFVENATFGRRNIGLSKSRTTAQIEIDKEFGAVGFWSSLSLHATLRGTYDAVYDLNDNDFGDSAGGPVLIANFGGPGIGMPAAVPHGGGVNLPIGGFDLAANPNEGLMVLGEPLHGTVFGLSFAVPVRPCNVDPRGCIAGYMDATEANLRFPEFNNRVDVLREIYFDAAVLTDSGDEINFRVGRQQVVWGRTDLFRVLDVVNPVDFSRNNIYDELEDIRIPMWILQAEYRFGATNAFDDLNFSVMWNFDKFRPNNLGQGGTPNRILDAGQFFRGMHNCWVNGCTVSNFAPVDPTDPSLGLLATNFAPGIIGIRQANLPEWKIDNTQIGAKIEGVFRGVGFSLNYLNYISQLPSLRGGIPALNPFAPFTGPDCVGPTVPLGCPLPADFTPAPRPFLVAFDIAFPRLKLYGGSLDFYVDAIKSVFRVEFAYTTGEEFANTLRPELFSQSDVIRYVIGWDRDTFIPFLNKTKAFFISAQLFGQHLLDHELEQRPLGMAGIPDWKSNWVATLLIKGWWMQNRLSPQFLTAFDFKADAVTIAPSIDWLINDSWRIMLIANVKFGTGARVFDDCRTCNPFPPFTASPGQAAPGSLGLGGLEPLGRFRSGPLGMAQMEDEIQIILRYRF